MEQEKRLPETENIEKDPLGRGVRNCFELFEEVIIAVVAVVLIFAFLFRVVTVNGDSMLPNYTEDDKLIISGMFYEVKQGDVVVVVNVLEDPIIKRVIALPGQVVDIDNDTGMVSVDGEVLDESAYTENGLTVSYGADMMTFPQTVPEGCVFVLGDNRVISKDSRYLAVGMVDSRNILGKVEVRIFPFDRIGKAK